MSIVDDPTATKDVETAATHQASNNDCRRSNRSEETKVSDGSIERNRRWRYYDLAFGPAQPDSLNAYESLFSQVALRPVKDILELGCGTGRYLSALGERGYTMTGVDADPVALAMAKDKVEKGGHHADFVHADLASWTPEHAYDAAISPNNSLKWLDSHHSLRECISRIAGAVRPGGIVALDLSFQMSNWRLVDWGTDEDMAEHAWVSSFRTDDLSGEYLCYMGVPDVENGRAPFIERLCCKDRGEDVKIEDRTTWLMFSGNEFRSWVLETGLLKEAKFYDRMAATPTEVKQSLLDRWLVQCWIVARRSQ